MDLCPSCNHPKCDVRCDLHLDNFLSYMPGKECPCCMFKESAEGLIKLNIRKQLAQELIDAALIWRQADEEEPIPSTIVKDKLLLLAYAVDAYREATE